MKIKPRPLLLVVENREFVLTEYLRWVSKVCLNREIGGIYFWDGKLRPIWWMRHEMIKWALKNTNCEHILFVDSDTIPPENAIETLLSHNLPVVGGYYQDMDGRIINRKDGKPYLGKVLEEVDGLSMGFSLWQRQVLLDVEYTKPDNDVQMDGDMEFCKKVKEKGYKIYQDFNLKADHILLKNF